MREFLKFYLDVFRTIPSIMRGRAETLTFWLGVIVLLVVYAKPELAQKFDDPVNTRKMAGIVLIVGLGQAVLRANYAHYKALEKNWKEAHSLVMNERIHSSQQTALGNLRRSYIEIMNDCVLPAADIHAIREKMQENDKWAYGFLQTQFNGGEASLLTMDRLPQALDLNAMALAREGKAELTSVYLDAQRKAEQIGSLIGARRIVSIPHKASV